MPKSRPVAPLRVFLSYSHHDEALCERFLVYLRQLQRHGLIQPWHDRRITPGQDWAGAIDDHIESADLIILLVSADFIASDYINDVEMKHALERSQSGEARLVPVILKPCEWQTSPFARPQALPKDGRPVVHWPTIDDGFDNVVKGLRRLIVELCGPAPVEARVVWTVRHHPWRWAGGALLAALVIALWALWSAGQRYLKQGTDALNRGGYADARPALERAKALNPFSAMARCGLKAVELDANRADERHVNEAIQEFPDCAYLKVLRGDRKYRRDDLPGALADYQEAVNREPLLAEAHFNLGRVLDRQAKPDSAEPEYRRALELWDTPRYRHNLADLYFKSENYDRAVEEYGQIAKSPRSALALAKIYRLQGKLEQARGREEDAIRELRDPAIQEAESQFAWELPVSATKSLRLVGVDEMQCYADLELAVTRFLQGYESEAATTVPAAFEKCSPRRHELREILGWELRRLGSENPELGERSGRFAQRFLAAGR
jgi:tetratricopeptide (TPR) repeat protein